jgi:hypothetical protein
MTVDPQESVAERNGRCHQKRAVGCSVRAPVRPPPCSVATQAVGGKRYLCVNLEDSGKYGCDETSNMTYSL